MAKCDGVPVFNALWTCMTSRYIRAQVLTLTKAHEERIGPLTEVAQSAKRYGHPPPPIVFSDDPVKDKRLVYTAFPSLAEGLTPISAAHGLKPLTMPSTVHLNFLPNSDLCEKALSSLMAPLDIDPNAHLCISIDAEWNTSRRVGVSILQLAPHSDQDNIFIIPVHRFTTLPPTLLRILISDRVFKIGVSVQADLTRLKKQFSQLSQQSSFNLIDLKEYCINRALILRKDSGALQNLAEKLLGAYLPKEDRLRRCDDWETKTLDNDHIQYAALDVFASRLVFEKASLTPRIAQITVATPGGTRVALLVQEGGAVVAYGQVSAQQPTTLGKIRVKTPTRTRLVIDVNTVLNSSAAAILHTVPGERVSRTKAGSLTLGQLQAASSSETGVAGVFQVVFPVNLLDFDRREPSQVHKHHERFSTNSYPSLESTNLCSSEAQSPVNAQHDDDKSDSLDDLKLINDLSDNEHDDSQLASLNMLEAHSAISSETMQATKLRETSTLSSEVLAVNDIISILQELVKSPPDANEEYQGIKKDLFHAFQMIPLPINHGMRPAFLRALRDHMMRWDPDIRANVDQTCQRIFKCTFDDMLARNPRFICERTPRYVPPPSVLVPALQHVFNTFGSALDSKTQQPLFNKTSWQKADAIVHLAREGYLSDRKDVPMYKKARIDKYGLQVYSSLRGTNKVEGGPHSDIYRKFSALHDGAASYSDWTNGDLYEQSNEQFGICAFPGASSLSLYIGRQLNVVSEALRVRLGMEMYSEQTTSKFKIKSNSNEDWLRQRQGLALPALPPTTPAARQYFFSKIRHYAALASSNGKSTADGEDRFYITNDVLAAYAKAWEKISNIRASQELISDGMKLLSETKTAFAGSNVPFPSFITKPTLLSGLAPSEAVIDFDGPIPPSLSVDLPLSCTFAPSTSGHNTQDPNPDIDGSVQTLATCVPTSTHAEELSSNVTQPNPPKVIQPISFAPDLSNIRNAILIRTESTDSAVSVSDLRPSKRRRREIPAADRKRVT
ncbi:hypothetical protein H0H92_014893, partial [Tricholoma furcatifolium]